MSNGFMKRIKSIKAAIEARRPNRITVVYENGSRAEMSILAAIDEICKRQDIVGVIANDETTASLFRAMIGPWNFSDLEELQE